MRRSLTISLFLHAAILASAFIVLPNPKEFKVEDQEMIPVDIITTEDLSKRQATVKTPEKPVEKAAPKPVDVVKPVKPAPEVAPEVSTAAHEPTAPPAPEPPKEKPKPEAKPEPAPTPEEMAELSKIIEEKPKEKKPETKAEAKPKNKPDSKPPDKPDKKKPKPKFDMAAIEEAILDKKDGERAAPLDPKTETGTPKQGAFNLSGEDAAIAASIGDAIKQKIATCWNIPPGAREADISIKVHFQLNADGTVLGLPQVVNNSSDPLFTTTAQSAVSALMECGPYDFLPQDRYDLWQENTMTVNPNQMFPS